MSKVLSVFILCSDKQFKSASIVRIECCVLDASGTMIDEITLNAYVPNETHFQVKCVEDFWSHNLRQLLKISCDGPLVDAQKNMITSFHAFIEKHSDSIMCANNEPFNVSLLNTLYEEFLPEKTLPKIYDLATAELFSHDEYTSDSDLGIAYNTAHKFHLLLNKQL